jgi:dipeptidyl aminopeptidase/acylaminoacyl peptidase
MTGPERVERQLQGILEDLAVPRRPEYLDDLHRQLAATGQRPAWTLPERWLPMTEFAGRVTIAPRIPYRSIAVALLLIGLLVAASLAWIGSRPRVPAPFGPARNGSVLSVPTDGINLYAIDPTTGVKTMVLEGAPPEGRSIGAAVYTPDGTHIVFQSHDWQSWRLRAIDSKGGGMTLITPNALFDPGGWQIAPDSRSVLLTSLVDGIRKMSLAKLDGSGMDALDVGHLSVVDAWYRPVDGDQIVFTASTDPESGEVGLYLRDGDGVVHTLIEPEAEAWIHDAAFSPDGTTIAYTRQLPGQDQVRVYVAQVDATGQNITPGVVIGHDSRAKYEMWPLWSPDGSRILIERTLESDGADIGAHPVVISADGKNEVGIHDTISVNGASKAWSPDGLMILVRHVDAQGHELAQTMWDPNRGQVRPAPWDATGVPSMQRLAN